MNKTTFMLTMSEMLVDTRLDTHEGKGLKWYKSLPLNNRINIKDAFVLLCGIDFQSISFLFTLRQRIELIYGKLVQEKIIEEV